MHFLWTLQTQSVSLINHVSVQFQHSKICGKFFPVRCLFNIYSSMENTSYRNMITEVREKTERFIATYYEQMLIILYYNYKDD